MFDLQNEQVFDTVTEHEFENLSDPTRTFQPMTAPIHDIAPRHTPTVRPHRRPAMQTAHLATHPSVHPRRAASRPAGQWRGGRPASNDTHVLSSRLLILLVSLAVVLLLFSGRVSADQPLVVEHHVVEAGDTLWEIAAGVTPAGEDVRATVAVIRELNELADATLMPGQRLVIPAG
jgi:hypothetical protein